MIEVEAPDGTIVEFPDETDDNTIDRVMRENFSPAPERGIGQMLYDNVIGDPNDGVQSYGEQLGTWLNRGGESMTLGAVGDEASAAVMGMLLGRSYDSELERYRQNEENMSTAGKLSADIFGAVLPALLPGGATASATRLGRAAQTVGRYAPTNVAARFIAGGGNTLTRSGRGLLAGAMMGAGQGFMEGEGDADKRLMNAGSGAVIGAGTGAVGSVIGDAVSGIARSRATNRAIAEAAKGAPSSEALRAEGNALYRQIDDAGVQIRPEAFDRMRAGMVDDLRGNTGYTELPGNTLTPNTKTVMDIMDNASTAMRSDPTAALPFRELDRIRRQAGGAAGNVTNRTDQAAGTQVIHNLDDFVQNLGPDDIVAGDVEALQSAIPKAREVWSRMSKSQKIDDAMDDSLAYLGGGASGIRNQFKNLLKNKKAMRGFSDMEKTAMRKVVNGGPLARLVTMAGNGLGQAMTIGGGVAVGGLPGLIGGAALATGQRKLSEALTGRAAEQARAAIASGGLNRPGLMQEILGAGEAPGQIGRQGTMGLMGSIIDARRSQQ